MDNLGNRSPMLVGRLQAATTEVDNCHSRRQLTSGDRALVTRKAKINDRDLDPRTIQAVILPDVSPRRTNLLPRHDRGPMKSRGSHAQHPARMSERSELGRTHESLNRPPNMSLEATLNTTDCDDASVTCRRAVDNHSDTPADDGNTRGACQAECRP
jgi:hypothetical protein